MAYGFSEFSRRASETHSFVVNMETKNPYANLVLRAALPEILFVGDVASALRMSRPSTRKAILRGDCGPYFRVGRRLALLRSSMLDTFDRRSTDPSAAVPQICIATDDSSVG